jgi:putative aldouronate transport system permease protein
MAKSKGETGARKLSPSAVLKKYWFFYLLALPGLAALMLFNYVPMYGLILGFKDWNIKLGILGSPWTSMNGLRHFRSFLTDGYFWSVMRNTVKINI